MNKAASSLLTFGILLAVLLFFQLDPAKHALFPQCLLYSTCGIYCPGCGSQRAVHCFLHFDLAGVVRNNLLFLPATFLLLYHYLRPLLNRWLHRKLPNILYYKHTPWFVLAVVVTFWVTRNLPGYPFSLLAPG